MDRFKVDAQLVRHDLRRRGLVTLTAADIGQDDLDASIALHAYHGGLGRARCVSLPRGENVRGLIRGAGFDGQGKAQPEPASL